MPHAAGAFNLEPIAQKWLELAKRRLLHYSDLYRSGRWTRYYASQQEFAEKMHEAVKAAQIWARLAGRRGLADDGKDDLRPAA
jgi:uncharacterized repeat protein (TIGR03809 family)